MISVENPQSIQKLQYPDLQHHCNHRSGLGRTSFPFRLFDYHGDVLMKEDMEMMSTLLDSAFPSLYNGIRRGRHYSYDLASSDSQFESANVHPTSDVKVIPIKVEHDPVRYQRSNNVNFRLLNGFPKKTEDRRQDSSSFFSGDFPEFFDSSFSNFSPPINSNSPKDYEACFSTATLEADKRTVSPKAKKSSELNEVDSFSLDSRQNSQRYHTENDSNERKADIWKSIPVEHFESSNVSRSPEMCNFNNNSSDKKYSQMPTNSASVDSERDDIEFSSLKCTENSSIPRIQLSTDTITDPEFGENEINYPPNYPIYDVLKIKLVQDSRKIDYIRGDGNCFFRALSKGLYGSEQYHRTVRNFIVDIIATNKSKFAPFVDKEDVQDHVRRMSEDHCWATTCEIYAATTLLQRDIFMLTPDHLNENYSWLLFKPVFQIEAPSGMSSHSCYISLCNTNGNHYDRVVPDHGGCNCFLPFPQLGKVV